MQNNSLSEDEKSEKMNRSISYKMKKISKIDKFKQEMSSSDEFKADKKFIPPETDFFPWLAKEIRKLVLEKDFIKSR